MKWGRKCSSWYLWFIFLFMWFMFRKCTIGTVLLENKTTKFLAVYRNIWNNKLLNPANITLFITFIHFKHFTSISNRSVTLYTKLNIYVFLLILLIWKNYGWVETIECNNLSGNIWSNSKQHNYNKCLWFYYANVEL